LNLTLAETLVDAETGEIIVEKGTVLTHQDQSLLLHVLDLLVKRL
jgi:DNA-directed RNA polymerase subunit beta